MLARGCRSTGALCGDTVPQVWFSRHLSLDQELRLNLGGWLFGSAHEYVQCEFVYSAHAHNTDIDTNTHACKTRSTLTHNTHTQRYATHRHNTYTYNTYMHIYSQHMHMIHICTHTTHIHIQNIHRTEAESILIIIGMISLYQNCSLARHLTTRDQSMQRARDPLCSLTNNRENEDVPTSSGNSS